MGEWQTFTVRVRSRSLEPTTAEELHEMLLNFIFTALDDDDVEVARWPRGSGRALVDEGESAR